MKPSNQYNFFSQHYITTGDAGGMESHPLATKTNGENLHNPPFLSSLPPERCTLRARRERETKILFLRATPMEDVVPNFRSPYPVDSIPPRVASRWVTTLGDSATWRFYVVARCASARRRNRIYYPPLRHGIGDGGGDVCSDLIESNRTIIEPDRLLSREASGPADAAVHDAVRWRRNH